MVDVDGLFDMCKKCKGTGYESHGVRKRSQLIDCDPGDYTRRWHVVYQWIFRKMCIAREDAIRIISAAISEERVTP